MSNKVFDLNEHKDHKQRIQELEEEVLKLWVSIEMLQLALSKAFNPDKETRFLPSKDKDEKPQGN